MKANIHYIFLVLLLVAGRCNASLSRYPLCSKDSDCATGKVCRDKKCFTHCEWDRDCAADENCYEWSQICVPKDRKKGSPCEEHWNCNKDLYCSLSTKTCKAKKAAGEFCVSGAQCKSNSCKFFGCK